MHHARLLKIAAAALILILAGGSTLAEKISILGPRNRGPGPSIVTERVSLNPSKDNTLYEDFAGTFSNGAGWRIFTGRSGAGSIRRAVLAFDIAGNIPPGSTIESATLYLMVVQTQTGPQNVGVHRLLADWGEGASVAMGGGGGGIPAEPGDATWIHTFFDNEFWSQPGGDFLTTPSATTEVGAAGIYAWGPNFELADDVQGWLDDPSSNFGWIVIGNEETSPTSKAFGSRENSIGEFWPLLDIDYTPGDPVDPDPDGEQDDSESDSEDDAEADHGADDFRSGLLDLGFTGSSGTNDLPAAVRGIFDRPNAQPSGRRSTRVPTRTRRR